MKIKKPKIRMPRATWHIKPTERVKDDDTKYNRKKENQRWRKEEY